ncbi:heme biosynthesis HemY N-terminal domain-containing protein [Aquisalimonas sp.]|uniref:heme biosynthesis HemY N-terminal domain-containing protein n=1 Tax=Aquisalimonas sp. TaxID=1872621 RepID=UPI0025C4CC02|nr:heme biosynthesis HemY N-terminal domain-containing protein [Aquisalimonas sp.]
MKRLFLLLLVLFASALVALWFHEQSGYVLISVGALTMETSLFLAIGALFAAFLALLLLLGTLRRVGGMPRGVRNWVAVRRIGRSRDRLVRGLARLAEGDYQQAERSLIRAVDDSETPVLHYLSAAWAAHRVGAGGRRDSYLALADKADPNARLAIGLLQAQLYLEDEQWETAFATLNLLQERYPRHPRVLHMLARACEVLGEWERLLDLTPRLRRHTSMDSARLSALQQAAATGVLEQAARQSRDALDRAWDRFPKALQEDPVVLLAYVDGILAFSPGSEKVEKRLRLALRKQWDSRYVDRYGRLQMDDPERPFNVAEAWLREHPEDPSLLLAVGRLAIRSRLWGRARSYLEACVARQPSAEACYLLADLLEHLGERDAARRAYRRAAEQAGGFRPMPELEHVRQAQALVAAQS